MRVVGRFLPLVFVLPLFAVAAAQEPAKKDTEGLSAVNANGKEMTFKKWEVVRGTRFIVGLPEKVGKDEPPAPLPAKVEYLEFREDTSTTYVEGIVTLVPMTSLRKAEYDDKNKSVAVTLIDTDGKEAVLAGTTRFKEFNKLIIDAKVDVGDLGPSTLRLPGGMLNTSPAIRSFHFPQSKPRPKVTGPVMVVAGLDKDKTLHKVQDLQALYRVGGVDRISTDLIFKKDARISVAKIANFRRAPAEKKQVSSEWEVTMADGSQVNLQLVKDVFPDTGAAAQFLGLIGKVSVGYKLFPVHTFIDVRQEGKTPLPTPEKPLILTGGKGPILEYVGKYGPKVTGADVGVALSGTHPVKETNGRVLATGTKEVHVAVMFAGKQGAAILEIELFDVKGKVDCRQRPVIFREENVVTGVNIVRMGFDSKGAKFDDGPYQAKVSLDGRVVALINWEIGETKKAVPTEGGN